MLVRKITLLSKAFAKHQPWLHQPSARCWVIHHVHVSCFWHQQKIPVSLMEKQIFLHSIDEQCSNAHCACDKFNDYENIYVSTFYMCIWQDGNFKYGTRLQNQCNTIKKCIYIYVSKRQLGGVYMYVPCHQNSKKSLLQQLAVKLLAWNTCQNHLMTFLNLCDC